MLLALHLEKILIEIQQNFKKRVAITLEDQISCYHILQRLKKDILILKIASKKFYDDDSRFSLTNSKYIVSRQTSIRQDSIRRSSIKNMASNSIHKEKNDVFSGDVKRKLDKSIVQNLRDSSSNDIFTEKHRNYVEKKKEMDNQKKKKIMNNTDFIFYLLFLQC